MGEKAFRFLVVDDEPDLRELIVLILGSQFKSQFSEAGNATEAIKIIEKENYQFDFIVSDFNMPKGNGGTLAKYVREKMPNTPFLLVTSDDRRDHEEILSAPLTGYFEKPFEEKKLTSEINRLLTKDGVNQEPSAPIYMPIALTSLERMGSVDCPLFVKLSDNHFVKVLAPKETFNEQLMQRFQNKGIAYLYINKDHFDSVLESFKNLVQNDIYLAALKDKKTEALKLSKTLQELIHTATRTFGWNEKVLELGNQGIRLMQNMVKHDSSLNEIYDWFDDDFHDVGVFTSILLTYTLASMANQLNFKNPRAFDYLSLAAFLHDLPLSDHLIRNQRKFIKAMQLGIPANKEELEKIKSHSSHTTELLSKWDHCPKEVIKIIELHTERPDGSGFPRGIHATDMDELAGTFIVANEVVQLYINHRDRNSLLSELSSMSGIYGQYPQTKQAYALALSQLSR